MSDNLRNLALEYLWCTGITLAVFSTEGKTPDETDILNVSYSWQEMSFLSNFNTLVKIPLGLTDLKESTEDMTFSISVLSVWLTKKETLDLFYRKSEKRSVVVASKNSSWKYLRLPLDWN